MVDEFEATKDNQLLNFNYNSPKQLSSLSFNSVDQQHAPLPYATKKSTPASGNYFRTPAEITFLGPSPRSQLGVPTNQVYRGKVKKYYRPVLSNANWVRGNQFGIINPYKKSRKYYETVSIPSVIPDKNGPVDYLGNDSKIVIRNNDPFYPYPSQHLLENKDYWSYMHPHKYLNGQPIYNYEHGKMEGVSRGKYTGGKGYDPYNPNEVENFCCGKSNENEIVENFSNCQGCSPCQNSNNFIMIFFAIAIMTAILLLVLKYKK